MLNTSRVIVHTLREKFEIAALFLRLGPPFTLICHENGASLVNAHDAEEF